MVAKVTKHMSAYCTATFLCPFPPLSQSSVIGSASILSSLGVVKRRHHRSLAPQPTWITPVCRKEGTTDSASPHSTRLLARCTRQSCPSAESPGFFNPISTYKSADSQHLTLRQHHLTQPHQASSTREQHVWLLQQRPSASARRLRSTSYVTFIISPTSLANTRRAAPQQGYGQPPREYPRLRDRIQIQTSSLQTD